MQIVWNKEIHFWHFYLQLIVKEKEILRLRKMLEGGRPYSAVTTDCYCKKSDKLNGIRNGECNEIDVLRRTKIDLEQQLKGLQMKKEKFEKQKI